VAKKIKPGPKTEGQRQFQLIEGTEAELADKVACAMALIGHWRRGVRIPSDKHKKRLDLLFGIPPRAWDVEPGANLVEPKKEPRSRSKLASRAKGLDTLGITKLQIDDILDALDDEDLTDGASAKLRDTLAKALALRTRLERDRELLEDRFVREHPEWLKLKTNIIKALEPHPKAAKAVLEAIGGDK